MTATQVSGVGELRATLDRDGYVGLPGLMPRAWARRLGEDYAPLLTEALGRPRGTADRGPHRYYQAVYLDQVPGVVDLVSHPVLDGLLTDTLGADYRFVEVAFDTPCPGATAQPWHRDFPLPVGASSIDALAVNATTVDVTPGMAPFAIALGTHRDDGTDFVEGRCVPEHRRAAYDERGVSRLARLGDVSVRTPLTIHRGQANLTAHRRPTLVVGAVARHVVTGPAFVVAMTRACHASLDPAVRRHFTDVALVDELVPIEQDYALRCIAGH